jgi:outer membrane protein OmpA-like peptidoglycan-associated protein
MHTARLAKTTRSQSKQQTTNQAVAQPVLQQSGVTADLLALQHSAGNHAVNQLLQQREQTGPASSSSNTIVGGAVPPIVRDVLNDPGQPLDSATRAFMEPRFGHDFSHVRVHIDEQAAKSAQNIHARAYTVGQHIVFDKGNYIPESSEGKRIIGHELSHVIQQERATTLMPPTTRGDITEQAAQLAVQAALEQGRRPVLSPTRLGIARDEPETMSTKRVHYEPGEREGSKTSLGQVDRLTNDAFVLFDFEVNEANLKPDHEMFLDQLVESYKLRYSYSTEQTPQKENERPLAAIRMIQGYTDLVDTERVNAPLRQRRAEAVAQYLVNRLGVSASNLDVIRGAPPGSMLTANTTPEGRAHNRAVEIRMEKISEVTTQKEVSVEQQRYFSDKWALASVSSMALGDILGGGVGLFTLKNRLTGETRNMLFAGVGLAGGAGLSSKMDKISKFLPARPSVSLPVSFKDFETDRPHTWENFTGPGFIEILSVTGFVAGYQWGYAHFNRSVVLKPNRGISISGAQANIGLGAFGAILIGYWFFM